jgi:hypothetical protein
LCSHITELRSDTEEEGVLLGKWLVFEGSLGSAGCSLSGHIGVGDLGNGSEEEYDSKDEYEDGDTLLHMYN